jgi:hypothetical protein
MALEARTQSTTYLAGTIGSESAITGRGRRDPAISRACFDRKFIVLRQESNIMRESEVHLGSSRQLPKQEY